MNDHHENSPAASLLNPDPAHNYSEQELDAIEALDPALALRIDRTQVLAQRLQGEQIQDKPVERTDVEQSIEEARRILQQDGGDIELVELDDRIVRVRLKGACVGCPNSAMDLKNVVERLVRARSPGVIKVENVF